MSVVDDEIKVGDTGSVRVDNERSDHTESIAVPECVKMGIAQTAIRQRFQNNGWAPILGCGWFGHVLEIPLCRRHRQMDKLQFRERMRLTPTDGG